MKAIGYAHFGAAKDVLFPLETPTPNPADGQVLVRLIRSGVNPSDAKARAGSRPGVTKPAFETIIPHSDGAGIIETVGTGVDTNRIGQRVWIWNGQWQRAFGTAAEYIALDAAQAITMPDEMTFDIGATMGIPGLTAAHSVFGNGEVDGQILLISGAAGAFGHNAVQLAKWGGATVIATASPDGFKRARAAGADTVLDYRSPDLASEINDITQGSGVDRAVEVEFGRNADMLARVVKPNGTVAAYGSGLDMSPTFPFGPYLFRSITLDIILIYLLPWALRKPAIIRLHKAFGDNKLQPEIHAQFSFSDCPAAHAAVEAGKRSGAVLLQIGTD
ncbi:MAG: NADPH:quinone reductase [Paracoccaceae bacterium]|nr:NADPH:quinone reductase [Paracoccaceae bacterium]